MIITRMRRSNEHERDGKMGLVLGQSGSRVLLFWEQDIFIKQGGGTGALSQSDRKVEEERKAVCPSQLCSKGHCSVYLEAPSKLYP